MIVRTNFELFLRIELKDRRSFRKDKRNKGFLKSVASNMMSIVVILL